MRGQLSKIFHFFSDKKRLFLIAERGFAPFSALAENFFVTNAPRNTLYRIAGEVIGYILSVLCVRDNGVSMLRKHALQRASSMSTARQPLLLSIETKN